jgi:phosphoserine phosphatase
LAQRAVSRSGSARPEMKVKVARMHRRLAAGRGHRVVERTIEGSQRQLSVPVLNLIEDARQRGDWVILATAAPAVYARPLAETLGFDTCLATSAGANEPGEELLGEKKAEAVRKLLADRNLQRAHLVVVSDHLDDLPLFRMADEYVLHADDLTAALIEQSLRLPATARLNPVAAEHDGGIWMWFDDRPVGPLDRWEVATVLSKHRYSLIYVGEGRWARVQPGDSLDPAVLRATCPRPPGVRQRVTTSTRRRVVRDRLGIFH